MVSAIVVSYNTAGLLRECLRSLQAAATRTPLEIIVWDNASSDGSADMVAHEFPSVRLLRSERNVGFAVANNRAADMAAGEWLMLLNSDATVAPDTLPALLEVAAAYPEAGILAPRLTYPDGTHQPSARRFPSALGLILEAGGLDRLIGYSAYARRPRTGPPYRVDYASGAALLVRRALWQRLGGFDDAFFFYGEDADLAARAADEGLVTLYCPDVVAVHVGGASSAALRRSAAVEGYRAVFLFLRRHRGRLAVPVARAAVALGAALRLVCVAPPAWLGHDGDMRARARTYAAVLRLALSRDPFPPGGFLSD